MQNNLSTASQLKSNEIMLISLRNVKLVFKVKLQKLLLTLWLYVILLIGLLLHILVELSFRALALYLTGIQLIILIRKLGSIRNCQSMALLMNLDGPLNLVYLILLVWYMDVQNDIIKFFTYGILIYHFFCLALLIVLPKTGDHYNQLSTITLLAITSKSLITLQMVFVILKWTRTITWTWYQTFIIFWISFGIIIFLEVCLLFDYISKKFQSRNKERSDQQNLDLFGNAWTNLFLFGFGVLPILALLCICQNLNSGDTKMSLYCLVLQITYLAIITAYSYYNKQNLILFFTNIQLRMDFQEVIDNNNSPSVVNSHQQSSHTPIQDQDRRQQNLQQLNQEQAVNIPQFLIKLSSTYFETEIKQSPKQDPKQNETRFDILMSSPRQKIKKDDEGSNLQCLVCFDRECEMVNMPCGHGGLCEICAINLFEKNCECFLCREQVNQVLKVAKPDNQRVRVIGFVREI